jgi:hypothetical protein
MEMDLSLAVVLRTFREPLLPKEGTCSPPHVVPRQNTLEQVSLINCEFESNTTFARLSFIVFLFYLTMKVFALA